jgi:hypothetical protein
MCISYVISEMESCGNKNFQKKESSKRGSGVAESIATPRPSERSLISVAITLGEKILCVDSIG